MDCNDDTICPFVTAQRLIQGKWAILYYALFK
jgi:hypothetical protein